MSKDKNSPSIRGGMRLDNVFEPINLFLINGNLVRGVFGVTKERRRQTHNQSLVGNVLNELRCGLVVRSQKEIQVFLIRRKLVNTFQIMISTHHLVSWVNRIQVFGRQHVTNSRSSKQFRRIGGIMSTIFGFSQITERDQGCFDASGTGLTKNVVPMLTTRFVILHFTRIDMQVSENAHKEFILGARTGKYCTGTSIITIQRPWL